MNGSITKMAVSETAQHETSIQDSDIENRNRHHDMLGMRLDYITVARFIDEFVRSAESGSNAYCCVPDVYQCVMCHDDPDHRAIVNAADYVFSDSTVMQFARAIAHGVAPIRTIRGGDIMLELCKEAQQREIPIALIGGRTEAVLSNIERELGNRFPELQIAYSHSPPFREMSEAEELALIGGINASGAKLVLIGLGCPKQERLMGRFHGKVQASMIGLGAAFDTIGGLVVASPAVVHRLGLEWLYRFMREPRRLYRRYMVSAPRFLWLLINKDQPENAQEPHHGPSHGH
jgi:N-acetylglucosaminyldiphosphoundecaprenol N-acetyl-beta-D-mannosaminyltransferase